MFVCLNRKFRIILTILFLLLSLLIPCSLSSNALGDNHNHTNITLVEKLVVKDSLVGGHGNLVFSPNGKYIAAGGVVISHGIHMKWSVLRVLDLETQKDISSTRVMKCHYQSIVITPDNETLIAQDSHGIHFWKFPHLGRYAEIVSPQKQTWRSISLSPDGKILAVVSDLNDCIFLYDLETRKKWKRLDGTYRNAAFSNDNRFLAAGSKRITIWDIPSWERHEIVANELQTNSRYKHHRLLFSPNGKYLFTNMIPNNSSYRRPGRIFPTPVILSLPETNTKEHNEIFSTATQRILASPDTRLNIRSAAFSPDSKILATIPNDTSTIILWETATGKEILNQENPNRHSAILFSPDGRFIATAGSPRSLIIWEIMTKAKNLQEK